MAGRDAIAGDVESGALGEIHTKAEPLPRLAAILLERSGGLDAGKRARVEGAAKQMARVAEALHVAADGGHAARTRKALSQLDGLLELIRTQYPVGALNEGSGGYGDHSNTRDSSPAAHAHRATPAGVVHVPPEAIVHVRALDTLRFEPRRIEVQAGIPTRIELENAGAAEHSLVVKTAGGDRDWVHIHVLPGASEAATYRLDTPGTYPVLCTIPGHTEAGMVGELVVLVR
ncbi:MAG: plastocyanin/azurin family copper-binding protein [Myxococcota bacterium]|nr:plastocyanin/azurin family copper-binding protein [Myxococcota bacterium]